MQFKKWQIQNPHGETEGEKRTLMEIKKQKRNEKHHVNKFEKLTELNGYFHGNFYLTLR